MDEQSAPLNTSPPRTLAELARQGRTASGRCSRAGSVRVGGSVGSSLTQTLLALGLGQGLNLPLALTLVLSLTRSLSSTLTLTLSR